MDIKEEGTGDTNIPKTNGSSAAKRVLLILNVLILAVGTCGGPLLMRLYFVHGGKRVWFSGWLQTCGWPITLLPLTAAYIHRRLTTRKTRLFLVDLRLFACAAVIGILVGVDNYLYAYGMDRLPVSTSSLIIATQLVFTALFAFVLVRQKFTSFSVNALVLLTIGAGMLALHSSRDRPNGESSKQYILGFVMTLGASALYGIILPSVELTYKKARQELTYVLVLEIQMIMCFFATLFCTVGMIVNNDFKAISREASEFGIGEAKYYLVVVWSAIIWQFFFVGAIGVIFCGSSLFSGIIIAVLLPVTEVLAVFFFKEKFSGEKGISLALSLWGFVSYFYGEVKLSRKRKLSRDSIINPETELSSV